MVYKGWIRTDSLILALVAGEAKIGTKIAGIDTTSPVTLSAGDEK